MARMKDVHFRRLADRSKSKVHLVIDGVALCEDDWFRSQTTEQATTAQFIADQCGLCVGYLDGTWRKRAAGIST
jgi:hypothetical protein